MRKQWLGLVVGALAVAGPLAGCGASDSSAGGSEAEYCAKLQDYQSQASGLSDAFSTADAAKIKKLFETVQDVVRSLDDNPPKEIAKDVHTVRTLTDELVKVLADSNYNAEVLMESEDFKKLSAKLDQGELSDAAARLAEWGKTTCKFGADTTVVPDTTVATSTPTSA